MKTISVIKLIMAYQFLLVVEVNTVMVFVVSLVDLIACVLSWLNAGGKALLKEGWVPIYNVA